MLLVTSTVKTVLSISQNGMDHITSNKQRDNHLNEDIMNASSILRFLSNFKIASFTVYKHDHFLS